MACRCVMPSQKKYASNVTFQSRVDWKATKTKLSMSLQACAQNVSRLERSTKNNCVVYSDICFLHQLSLFLHGGQMEELKKLEEFVFLAIIFYSLLWGMIFMFGEIIKELLK